MAGQVVEIFFLLEDVGLRRFLAPGETQENDGAIDLCGEHGAALRIDAIGFAVAAFLGAGGRRGAASREAEQNRQDGRSGKPGASCRATMHRNTSRDYSANPQGGRVAPSPTGGGGGATKLYPKGGRS